MATSPSGSNADRRLIKDIMKLQGCSDLQKCGISLHITDDINKLTAFIDGPPASPYVGAKFQLYILIPHDYPFAPPKMRFSTLIWHPNICSKTGKICVDILDEEWSPSLDLRSAILSVQNLLLNPEPDSPQDIEAGRQLRDNPEMFERTARVWAKEFGIGTEAKGDEEYNAILGHLVEMGIFKGVALRYLSENGWNLTSAVNHFLLD